MNHIFKTIFNPETGKIYVVSEKVKNGRKNTRNSRNTVIDDQVDQANLTQYFKKTVLSFSTGLIFLSLCNSTSFAAEQFYDGISGEPSLRPISSISGNLDRLLNNNILQGVISTNINDIPAISDSNLTIDYSTGTAPDFAIAGYAGMFGSSATLATSQNNNMILKRGEIKGNVYAGLIHYTEVVDSIDCTIPSSSCGSVIITKSIPNLNLNSNFNTINLNEDSINIAGDLNAGYSALNLEFESLTGGIVNDFSSNSATTYTNAYALSYAIYEDTKLITNENSIYLSSDDNDIHGNLNSGTSIIKIDFNSNQGGIANITGDNTGNIRASSYSDAHAYSSGNELTSNQNTIKLDGSNTTIRDSANAGVSSIILNFANFQGGVSAANNGDTSEAISSAYTSASLYGNQLTSSQNTITLESSNNTIGGNLNSGLATIKSNFGNLQGGSASATGVTSAKSSAFVHSEAFAYENTLTANQNAITINSNSNIIKGDLRSGASIIHLDFGNMQAGSASSIGNTSNTSSYTQAYFSTDDTELTANKNTITLMGNSNTIDGSLTAGNSSINATFGNLEAGSAITRADTLVAVSYGKSKLISNDNTVVIKGNNNTIGGVKAGNAAINLGFENTQSKTDPVHINIYSALTNFIASRNTISIEGDNNIIDGNLSAGISNVNIDLGNIKSDDSIAKYTVNLIKSNFKADENTINLKGASTINGNIHGGYIGLNASIGDIISGGGVQGESKIALDESSATAINNTINIDGNHTINNKDASIYGGYLTYSTINNIAYRPESYDTFTGNTLNFSNLKPITVDKIGNFQTYNFILNPEYANKNIALINADKVILDTNKDNSSTEIAKASDVYVVGIHSGKLLNTNTKFILMEGKSLDGEGQGHLTEGVAQQGISLLYDVETLVDKPNNQVIAIIRGGHGNPEVPTGPTVNPQLKGLLEGNLSGLMLLTRGADDITDNLMNAISDQNQKRGLIPYVILSGHYAHYNSGSYIKAKGGLINSGLSFQRDQLTLGAFVESGWGAYDTYNRFKNAATVEGEGHNNFLGLGAYGHYDFMNGIYLDGSFRGGRLHTAYHTDDIKNATTGESANYRLSGRYLSADIGSGYQFSLDPSNNLDFSLKYLWSGTQSQDLKIAGDPIHFNALNSHRLRIKGENTYKMNADYSILTGLGYEYEFDAKAEGTTYKHFDIEAPSVKGSTGLGTLGIRYNPASNKNLTVDFKANTYFGKRDGGSALLHLQYAF